MNRDMLKKFGCATLLVVGLSSRKAMDLENPARPRQRMGRRNERRLAKRRAMNKIAAKSRKVNRSKGR